MVRKHSYFTFAFRLSALAAVLFQLPVPAFDAVSQPASTSLKETRSEALHLSLFTPPIDHDLPNLAPLRASGQYSWIVMPAIAENWQTKKTELGLLVRVLGPASPPSGVVFVVDGTTTLVDGQRWEKAGSGAWVMVLGRQDLVRSVSKARQVSITVLGSPPLEAHFDQSSLTVFPQMVGMFEHNNFRGNAPESGPTQLPPTTPVIPTPAEPPAGNSATANEARKPNASENNRKDDLRTRVEEAAGMCRNHIMAGAKDPDSIVFANDYSYHLGSVLTRNWITINWEIVGRNTFGAVLRHRVTCIVSCAPKKTCTWMSMGDSPY